MYYCCASAFAQLGSLLADSYQWLMQGVRTVQTVVGKAAALAPFRKHHKKPCRIHIEATFFRVGADEVHAAAEGANTEQVSWVSCLDLHT